MHVPDGFLDVTTSAATGAVSAGGVAIALRRMRRLSQRAVPLTGLVAAFVFIAQMINFPVGAGTSGHLIGGALAAALLGPWLGVASMTVVVAVQAFLFADGGLTALGTNLLNLAIITPLVGWAVVRTTARWSRGSARAMWIGSFAAGLLSVVAAAAAFTIEYSAGGQGGAALGAVAAGVLGVHLLIGSVEGVVTAGVLGAVLRARPDLVAANDGVTSLAPARWSGGAVATATALAMVGIILVFLPFSSSDPDGLQRVAVDRGFVAEAQEHPLAEGPLAGYSADVEDGSGGARVAAVVGGGVVLLAAGAVAATARSREPV